MPVRLMTISEYARHRGCDEKAVRKALAEGRISRTGTDRRCIDPDVADIQWARNTRARGDSGAGVKPGADRPAAAAAGDEGGQAGEDYSSMRARRERAEAMMAEIELAKASGKSLDKEASLRAVYTRFRELRDNSKTIGRTLGPVLAPVNDPREIRILIDRAIDDVFATFARKTLQSLVESLAGADARVPADLHQAMPDDQEDAA